MADRFRTLTAVAALALASFAPASAAELVTSKENARQGSPVPSVISVAYRDPRIATNAAGVLRQGGLAVAGAARWMPATPEVAPTVAFDVPAVIGAAYHDRHRATTSAEVRSQSGFATAGRVRWLAAAPVTVEASADRLGSF